VKIRSVQFELSAVRPAQWPIDGLLEFAFIGRSNVGKSSLLNKLLARKSLARVSQKPGKTQQINFFQINSQLRFADLPGYGYAAVSKTSRAQFAKMIETYLTRRDPLVRVFHLIDIRHEPTKDDISFHQWLMTLGVQICVVATKLDKISKSAVKPSAGKIQAILNTPWPVFPVSAEKGTGIDELWTLIETDLTSEDGTEADASIDQVLISSEHAGKNQD
jgi:GTP-binding protein